jgi:drug/metabolite transporter (DMT)-like permease
VLVVLAWSQVAGLVLMWSWIGVAALATGMEVPMRSVLLGMLGGTAGAIGLGAFYRALAIGPMSVVPPITAAGVALPVAVGLLAGDTDPTPIVLGGIALAVCGVVLASIGEGHNVDDTIATRVSLRTIALCVLAACCFGVVFIAMDAAAGDSAATALVATGGVRVGGVLAIVLAAIVVRTRPWGGVTAPGLAAFVVIGLLDTCANLAFSLAAAFGELAIVAVLASLYPAVTSALAHALLGERLGRVQLVGVALALGGVVVLAIR